MFCTKCGKEIDDSATFCIYCGAPVNGGENAVPQSVPQPTPAQNDVPQFSAPQFNAQQNSAPQFAAGGTGFSVNLAPNVVDIINKILRGLLIVLAILILIGSIGMLASIGGAEKTNDPVKLVTGMVTFANLARVPAIISFVLALGGAVLAFLTKQRSLFAYIACGFGLLMFVFNFFLARFSSLWAMLVSITKLSFGPPIVGSIFLLISAVGMIVCSLVILLKKEDIIKFKPKF